MSDCGVRVQIGPPIITAFTGSGPYEVAWPEGATFEVGALAQIFGVSRKRIYNLLSQHRQHFGPKLYRRGRPGRRRTRIVTQEDFIKLRWIFRVVVKP